MKQFSFLHFSDLHIGDANQIGLTSKHKKDIFQDIKNIYKKVGSIDIVFFTGDLTQSGKKEEYQLLEQYLRELWDVFKTLNCNPPLVCVPGNHDLERLDDPFNSVSKVFRDWDNNRDIEKNCFWNNGDNEYIRFIRDRFSNYLQWYKSSSIPKPNDIEYGYISGDIRVDMQINGIKLGVIGLNSSYLQLTGDNYYGKLQLSPRQMTALFSGDIDYTNWQESKDVSLLLTHHSPDWYSQESRQLFNSEIYYDKSFCEHLCGHLHEPIQKSESVNGHNSKRMFVSPSLFGLECYADKSERIHGYTAGMFIIEDNKIYKKIWPRISKKINTGEIKIIPNYDYNIDDESQALTEIIRIDDSAPIALKAEIVTNLPESSDSLELKDNIFDSANIEDKLSRTSFIDTNSHKAVRKEERNRITNLLQDKHCGWIITKWGLGEDGFIGAVVYDSEINNANCFSVNCDDVESINDIQTQIEKKFSTSFTKFMSILCSLQNPLLVFSKMNSRVFDIPSNSEILSRYIQTLLDYAPNLNILITSNTTPPQNYFESVQLQPLDIPAVKLYAIPHGLEQLGINSHISIEKVHRMSGGLPLYVDRILSDLKFCSLADLIESDYQGNSQPLGVDEIITESMRREIHELRDSNDEANRKAFTLLKDLSLLHNGETFERIKRFNPQAPFHPHHVSLLENKDLIEISTINSLFDNESEAKYIKVIKVPKIIRDYVNSLITPEEKVDIYKSACSLYFGDNWRSGEIKINKKSDPETNLITYYNCQLSIRYLLFNAAENANELEIKRIAGIGIAFCDYLGNSSAYKDAVSMAEDMMPILEHIEGIDGIEDQKIALREMMGENLRMNGLREESIKILTEVLNDGQRFNDNKKADICLSIAHAYESLRDEDNATEYAQRVQKYAQDKTDYKHIASEAIIASFIEDKEKKIKKLKSLLTKANTNNCKSVASNIILSLSNLERDENSTKRLDSILKDNKGSVYNKVRAINEKMSYVIENKAPSELNETDLLNINIAYSYSFYQRLVRLLNKSHRIVWKYWHQQSAYEELLNVFRYSSFIWRLCDEMEEETKYINSLVSDDKFMAWLNATQTNKSINISYFVRRQSEFQSQA